MIVRSLGWLGTQGGCLVAKVRHSLPPTQVSYALALHQGSGAVEMYLL